MLSLRKHNSMSLYVQFPLNFFESVTLVVMCQQILMNLPTDFIKIWFSCCFILTGKLIDT